MTNLIRFAPAAAYLLFAPFIAVPGSADTHRIEWSPGSELRTDVTTSGSTFRLENGVHIDGVSGPARVVRLEIPPDARVSDVAIRPEIEHPLAPGATPAVAKADFDPGDPTGISAGYAYWVLPEGDYLGHRIAHVLISPFREEAGALRFLASFSIDLTLDQGASAPLSRRVHHPRTDASDHRALRALLDGEPRVDLSASGRNPAPLLPPEMSTDTVEYVIITDDAQAAAFQELADFKTREGTPALVTTVEWILANYAGADLSSRIRAYVRDLYLYQGLRYVLLGGDTDQVPTRVVVARHNAPSGVEVTTDKYFVCIDGNWNADGDSELGEWLADEVDLYAEIAIGRVPTSSPDDVAVFMNKWKSYTGYDPATFRDDYQTRVLSLGEVLFPGDWAYGDDPFHIAVDGSSLCESTLTYLSPGFERTRLYEYFDNPLTPGALPELKSTTISEINRGYGIIDHVGHGFRNNMSVGDGKLVNKDADEFTNTNAYSFLYAVNCTSGAILFDSIVEHLMLNPGGGIVAGIASTDLDYPLTSDGFKYEFFDLLFTEEVTTLSDLFHRADLPWLGLAGMAENGYRWTFMTLIAFGDPSMELWRSTPDTLDLAFSPTLELGAGSFAVTVSDEGSPVEGVRVTLSKEDGYGVGITDPSGVTTIPFLPGSEGSFTITAIRNGFVPAVDASTVITAATAALRVEELIFHDGTAGGGAGNGDGRPDAGESLVVDAVLRNDGTAAATGVQAVLHASNPFLTVTDSTAAGPTLGAGATDTLTAAFSLSVSSSLPDSLRHVVIQGTVDLGANEGAWTEETPFSIYQRLLDLIGLSWSIPDDDGDGFLESGETAEIHLTLTNRGEADAIAVVGVGSFSGSGFIVIDDTIQFGDVSPGGDVQGGSLRLLSTGGGAPGIEIELTVSDSHSPALLTRSIDVLLPAAPESLVADPRASSIRLTWLRPSSPDLRGYRVYRSDDESGPFDEITSDIIADGTFFADESPVPFTPYWYRIASVDSSGNESLPSASLLASTSPPLLEGWPVDLPPGESKGSPTFVDLDNDQSLEIVLGWSYPMVFRSDGGDFVDGDNNAQTPGIFADLEGGESQYWNSPAVIDIDGDQVLEMVFCAWPTSGPGHMYVLDATGAIEAGWPKEIGRQPWSSPAIGDIDGDGDFEIFVSSGSSSGTYQGVLFGFHHDGTEIRDGDSNPATEGVFFKSASPLASYLYGSPAIADIDGDEVDEVVYLEKTSHPAPTSSTLYVFNSNGSQSSGFPYGAGSLKGSTSSPAIADLDGNGTLEIVVVTTHQIAVVTSNGSDFPGWPKSLPNPSSGSFDINDFLSSPAIGDVDGDNQLDIALGWLNGTVYLWTGNGGASHPGFPVQVTSGGSQFQQYMRSPALGNLDADPNPEIVLGSGQAELFALNADGSVLPGFPLQVKGTVWGAPALWDIDDDGFVNLIVQSDGPSLEVFDFTNVPFNPGEYPWPMFRHDHKKSGHFHEEVIIGVEPEEGGLATPSVASVYPARPNPFVPRVNLPFDVPTGGQSVRIRVFDVGGREVRRLADGRFPAGSFRISWDGRTGSGERLAPGIYFARIEIGPDAFVQKLTMVR